MSVVSSLPDVSFAEKAADAVLSDLVAGYEAAAGRRLYPGDPVRLFLATIAYELAYQRSLIDYTGKMNLLAYATGDYLDQIGAMLGVTRLPAAHAVCTVRFLLQEARSQDTLIPEGTRVSDGGNVYFATAEAAVVSAGSLFADVQCLCTEAGSVGGGIAAGELNVLVDPIAYVVSVSNISAASGGADTEGDENLRERIRLAPESFSVAGPYGAYEFYARSAHQDIIDVAVMGPERTDGTYRVEPGEVHVFPLMAGGVLPSQDILNIVSAVLNDEKVRPLTDTVIVLSPEILNYQLSLTYYIDRKDAAVALSIQQAVENSVAEFIVWQRERLGRDVNVSELVRRVMEAGAKRVAVSSPEFTVTRANVVAVCTSSAVTFGGLEDA